MKKLFKILFVGAFVTTLSFNASAQDITWGVKAGMNISNVSNSGGDSKVGFVAGVTGEYFFSEKMGLSAELLYSCQGTKTSYDLSDYDLGQFDATMSTSYLNIPILFNYNIISGLTAKAGLQPGIYLGGTVTVNDDSEAISSGVKSIDLAMPIGLSYTLDMGLCFEARYNLGITKAMDSDSGSNRCFALTVGYKF